MLRFLARTTLTVLANAVGLFAAAAIVDGFSIEGASFIIALVIFSLSTILLGPFIAKVALSSAPYLMGGIALVTTFVGLLITAAISDGIQIEGLTTWILATLVIWIFSIIGNLILPLILFKKVLEDDDDKKSE